MRGRAAACLWAAVLLAGTVPVAAAPAAREGLEVGSHPLGIVSEGTTVYAALDTEEAAVAVDLSSGSVRRFDIGPGPEDVAVDRARKRLYVLHRQGRHAGSPGAVSIVDLRDGAVVRSVATGRGPTGIAADPRSGLVYAVNWISQSVTVIEPDGATSTIGGRRWRDRGYGWPASVAIDRRSGTAFVATNHGFVFALRGGRVVARARALPSDDSFDLAVDARRGLLYAAGASRGRVFELDTATLDVRRTIAVAGMEAEAIALDPQLRLLGVLGLSVPDQEATKLAIWDLGSRRRLGTASLGIGAFDVTVVPGSWTFYAGDSWGDQIVPVAADGEAPTSDRTDDAMVLDRGTRLRGSARDDLSGVVRVRVTYASAAGTEEVAARLRCTGGKCAWSAPPPASAGTYEVSITAVDAAGNVEPSDSVLLTWKP